MAWRRGEEKKYFLYELFSPARQRKLPTSHSLVLSWGFRGTFTALYWRILYLKKILIMKKLGELVVGSSDRKHQLLSDLHLKAEAVLSKSSAAPLFRFSSLEILKTSSLSSLVPGRWSGRGLPVMWCLCLCACARVRARRQVDLFNCSPFFYSEMPRAWSAQTDGGLMTNCASGNKELKINGPTHTRAPVNTPQLRYL